ncbi:MAG: hypothetical protein CSA76_00020, partial [Spirochaetales bacterium]
MNTSGYTWYLFDADGTLLDYPAAEEQALRKTAAAYALPMNSEIRSSYHSINSVMWNRLEQGTISSAELRWKRFEQLSVRYGWQIDPRRFSSDYLEQLSEGGFMIDGAEKMLERLLGSGFADGGGKTAGEAAGVTAGEAAGEAPKAGAAAKKGVTARAAAGEAPKAGAVKAAVITNGLRDVQFRRLEKAGILHFFEEIIISEDAPAPKPHSAYFDYALERIGFSRKEEILVIGDSLSSDIAGGAACGLDTCWFNAEGRALTGPWKPSFEIKNWEDFFTAV